MDLILIFILFSVISKIVGLFTGKKQVNRKRTKASTINNRSYSDISDPERHKNAKTSKRAKSPIFKERAYEDMSNIEQHSTTEQRERTREDFLEDNIFNTNFIDRESITKDVHLIRDDKNTLKRQGKSIISLTDMQKAIVMAEVLGKPKSLKK